MSELSGDKVFANSEEAGVLRHATLGSFVSNTWNVASWTPLHSYLLLGLATLGCLLPFSGKAFHIDDTLFVWTAQQIVHHPFNPYGFHLVWYVTDMSMSAITKNPPLSCYYGALVGMMAGWSETAWHIGFLVPALSLVLGTYHLARRFTASPLIAAAATLFAPGFLVSSTGVMCDVLMLALWVWAVIFWLKGIDSGKPLPLAVSCALVTACALTKYFGASLILLLPAYALLHWRQHWRQNRRRLGTWVWYLLIPVACLFWYQQWTKAIYGRGLLWDAAQYARSPEYVDQTSRLTSALVGLSFLGGCALPILLFSPFLWNRRQLIFGSLAGAVAGLAVGLRWLNPQIPQLEQNWLWIGLQFAFYVAGGISVLGLAVADYRKQGGADSILLGLWVLGTFFFAAFLNWTINARSVLPLIPAAAILLARRLDEAPGASTWWSTGKLAVPLALSAMISLFVAAGDTALANSGRTMASFIHGQTQNQARTIFFEGHWGFQYYMQLFGARPAEYDNFVFRTGDLVVIPAIATNTFPIPPQFVAAQESLQVDPHTHAATMALGAGFYSSQAGPLPFSFGRVPSESYSVVRLQQ
ncbi:MAG: glycosyltransferase family 39 protein [Terriglobales bacterium]